MSKPKTMEDWLVIIEELKVAWKLENGEDMPPEAVEQYLQLAKENVEWCQAQEKMARDTTTTSRNVTTAVFESLANALPKIESDLPEPSHKTLAEKVAEEAALCKKCKGECLKERDRWRIPEIEFAYEQEFVQYYTCKYGLQRKGQRELENKFRSARIPLRYLGKTIDDYKVDELNSVAVEFAKNALIAPFGAYFFGECGTGKTFLAAVIAQEFLRAGKSVIFAKVPSLLDDIKSTFDGKSNGTELDLLDKIKEVSLVVLDDFGMEKPTQWAGATLCKILDMRYDNPAARTIITSNMSPEDLAKHLNKASDGANLNGSRIFDRLREICKPILLKGTSRRN